DALAALLAISPDAWKIIALEYCDWVASAQFSFEYCDVLVKRIEHIFVNGDLECKGLAAISAAQLASSHNRWFAMNYVVHLCGPALEEQAAQRIAIEIRAADATGNFRRCALVIRKSEKDYHPRIAEVLLLSN